MTMNEFTGTLGHSAVTSSYQGFDLAFYYNCWATGSAQAEILNQLKSDNWGYNSDSQTEVLYGQNFGTLCKTDIASRLTTMHCLAEDSQQYALLLLAAGLAFTLVVFLAFLARSLGTSFTAITLAKQAPYECGFQPFAGLDRCSLFLFYRLAVFFIIFEAELIFLYPWVTSVAATGGDLNFFAAALPFLGLLLLGFM